MNVPGACLNKRPLYKGETLSINATKPKLTVPL